MPEKTCTACDETLDASRFYRDKMSKTGLKTRCKPCENAGRAASARVAREREDAAGVRTCKTCEVTKPFSEYFQTAHRDPSGIPRYRQKCKSCHQEYTNAWRRDHAAELLERRQASAERRYRKMKLIKYGITEAELSQMEAESAGTCRICLRQVAKLVIDHCHTSGRPRALLCATCNQGLGLFRDDPEALTRASQYLADYSE